MAKRSTIGCLHRSNTASTTLVRRRHSVGKTWRCLERRLPITSSLPGMCTVHSRHVLFMRTSNRSWVSSHNETDRVVALSVHVRDHCCVVSRYKECQSGMESKVKQCQSNSSYLEHIYEKVGFCCRPRLVTRHITQMSPPSSRTCIGEESQ